MTPTTELLEKLARNIDPVWREQQLKAGLCERDAEIAKLREALEQARISMAANREYCKGRALTHAGIDRCIEMADSVLKS